MRVSLSSGSSRPAPAVSRRRNAVRLSRSGTAFGDSRGKPLDNLSSDMIMQATQIPLRALLPPMSASPPGTPSYDPSRFTYPQNYAFSHLRLSRTLKDPSKTPVVLVACGSFSPVTYLHLRMFEMARDYIRQNTDFEIMAGYLSPVSDQYKKPGLLSAHHRVNMCTLAAEETNTWLTVDTWEAFQSYQRSAIVLDHFDYEINHRLGGVYTEDGEHRNVRIMLLAGSDLIATMSAPGVWSYADLDHILGRYGAFVIERAGNGLEQAIDTLQRWRSNIYLISQLIQNDVSSTKVRLFLRRGLSVRYLLPNPVVDYIEQHGLYLDDGVTNSPNPDKGKGKDRDSAFGKKELMAPS